MKKLLLITSFLASQLFAVECTKEQYKPEFTDKEQVRYMHSYYLTTDNSNVVIDKKSIIYDKKNEKIVCWVIYQQLESPNLGKIAIKYEYDLNKDMVRVLGATYYDCTGTTVKNFKTGDWNYISPNSGYEYVLNDLKEYLKIK